MNIHNLTKKNLFDGYVGPPPVLSRCYSSKANSTVFPGNTLLSMDKYLSNVRHFDRRNFHEIGAHRNDTVRAEGLKMPPLENKNTTACNPLVQIVGGFVGSKSQAGCTNLRGREFFLWDVIVDKLIEIMEPEIPKQTEPRRSEGIKDNRLGRVNGIVLGLSTFGCETLNKPDWRRECHNSRQQVTNEVTRTEKMPLSCYDSQFLVESALYPEMLSTVLPCPNILEQTSLTATQDQQPTMMLSANAMDDPNADDSGRGTPSNLETNSLSESMNDAEPIPCPSNPIFSVESSVSSTSKGISQGKSCSESIKNDSAPVSPSGTPASSIMFFSGSYLSFSESEDDAIDVKPALSSSCESGSTERSSLPPKRTLVQRSLSECSVESDDSFIVFECMQDDTNVQAPDDTTLKGSISSIQRCELFLEDSDSDFDSDVDLDEIDHCTLFPRDCDTFLPEPINRCDEANKKWNSFYGKSTVKDDADCLPKKVKFAQGKDLLKVRRIITWDFAHRAARIGPWEMYHRDSERFKNRITTIFAPALSPVLTAAHRKRIYSERFADAT